MKCTVVLILLILEDCVTDNDNEGLREPKGSSGFTSEARSADPALSSDWMKCSLEGEFQGASDLVQSKFDGTIILKGLDDQVCWRFDYGRSRLEVLWSLAWPDHQEPSKSKLQGKFHYNGYSTNVECLVQSYLVLEFWDSSDRLASLTWRGGEGKTCLLSSSETGSNATMGIRQYQVPLEQLQKHVIWKTAGFIGLEQVIQIEIQPHFQVKRRVGRNEPTQVTPSPLHAQQDHPYSALYPYCTNGEEETSFFIRRSKGLYLPPPGVRILPQGIRGEKVQTGQWGGPLVLDTLINFPEERVKTVYFWEGPKGLAWDVSLMNQEHFWSRVTESWDESGSIPGSYYTTRVMGFKRGSLLINPLFGGDAGKWTCHFCIPESLKFEGRNRSCIMRTVTKTVKVKKFQLPTIPNQVVDSLPVTTPEPELPLCETARVSKSGPFQLNQQRAIPIILEAQLELITWQINLRDWFISEVYPNCSYVAATLEHALSSWAHSAVQRKTKQRSLPKRKRKTRDIGNTILGGFGAGVGVENSIDIEDMSEVLQKLGTLGKQDVGTQRNVNAVLQQLVHNTFRVQGYTQRHIQSIFQGLITRNQGVAWEFVCLSMQTELTADFKIMAQALSEGKTPLQLNSDKDFIENLAGEGSFAWMHRDVWINKWGGCDLAFCTATSLVPTDGVAHVIFPVISLGTPFSSTHILHHEVKGQHFMLLHDEVTQIDLSSCWQFPDTYMCLPGQVRFSDEVCWRNYTNCPATIQKVLPEANLISPVAAGKVCFLNMKSKDTFSVQFHNCTAKVDLTRGTYCVTGDPTRIQSSRFDYAIPHLVKETLALHAPQEVPLLRDNTPWDKWVQVLKQDHTLLKVLDKHNTKLEVIFHHDQGSLKEIEHQYSQVSSSLTWWKRFLAMFQGHAKTGWTSAVQNFFLHPLVIVMGIAIICILIQVRLGCHLRKQINRVSRLVSRAPSYEPIFRD